MPFKIQFNLQKNFLILQKFITIWIFLIPLITSAKLDFCNDQFFVGHKVICSDGTDTCFEKLVQNQFHKCMENICYSDALCDRNSQTAAIRCRPCDLRTHVNWSEDSCQFLLKQSLLEKRVIPYEPLSCPNHNFDKPPVTSLESDSKCVSFQDQTARCKNTTDGRICNFSLSPDLKDLKCQWAQCNLKSKFDCDLAIQQQCEKSGNCVIPKEISLHNQACDKDPTLPGCNYCAVQISKSAELNEALDSAELNSNAYIQFKVSPEVQSAKYNCNGQEIQNLDFSSAQYLKIKITQDNYSCSLFYKTKKYIGSCKSNIVKIKECDPKLGGCFFGNSPILSQAKPKEDQKQQVVDKSLIASSHEVRSEFKRDFYREFLRVVFKPKSIPNYSSKLQNQRMPSSIDEFEIRTDFNEERHAVTTSEIILSLPITPLVEIKPEANPESLTTPKAEVKQESKLESSSLTILTPPVLSEIKLEAKVEEPNKQIVKEQDPSNCAVNQYFDKVKKACINTPIPTCAVVISSVKETSKALEMVVEGYEVQANIQIADVLSADLICSEMKVAKPLDLKNTQPLILKPVKDISCRVNYVNLNSVNGFCDSNNVKYIHVK